MPPSRPVETLERRGERSKISNLLELSDLENGQSRAEGEYNFDANGDGLHGYNIVKNEGGKLVYVRRVDFPTE